MTTSFAYPRPALLADYARAASGLVFAALAILLPMHWILVSLFGLLAALLLAFGARTWLRQKSRIELMPDAIRLAGPIERRIPWEALDRLELRYFSMRRDRKQGWMELSLAGNGTRLGIESQIEGFGEIVERAAEAAALRGLAVDQATETNLAALGIAYRTKR